MSARSSGRGGPRSGNGCGRRSRRSRPRSGCSSPSPGSACGYGCRRWRAPSCCARFVRADARLDRAARDGAVPVAPRRAAPPRPQRRPPPSSRDHDRRRAGARKADPWSVALWHAHVERALLAAQSRLRAGRPAPRLDLRDPMALRALVLILVVATFIAAGGERWQRIAAAFDWQGVVVPVNFRLDAWVSPPAYTARPPGDPARAAAGRTPPDLGRRNFGADRQRSRDPLQRQGRVRRRHHRRGRRGRRRPASPGAGRAPRSAASPITERGTAMVRGLSEEDLTYAFNAIPDKPPTIALTKDPETQARGSLQLNYKMEDDYGVVEAKAIFALKGAARRRCRRQAPAVRSARNAAVAAPGAGQERRRPDHQGSERASLGRRRGDDDPHSPATRPRTKAPAPPMSSGCRSGRSSSRSPAPSSSSGAISRSTPRPATRC